jgi:hypothetical protein
MARLAAAVARRAEARAAAAARLCAWVGGPGAGERRPQRCGRVGVALAGHGQAWLGAWMLARGAGTARAQARTRLGAGADAGTGAAAWACEHRSTWALVASTGARCTA